MGYWSASWNSWSSILELKIGEHLAFQVPSIHNSVIFHIIATPLCKLLDWYNLCAERNVNAERNVCAEHVCAMDDTQHRWTDTHHHHSPYQSPPPTPVSPTLQYLCIKTWFIEKRNGHTVMFRICIDHSMRGRGVSIVGQHAKHVADIAYECIVYWVGGDPLVGSIFHLKGSDM